MMHRPRAPGPASAAAALGRSPGEEDGPAVPPARYDHDAHEAVCPQ